MNDLPVSTEPAKSVQSQLEGLEKSIEYLSSQVNELENRLDPILSVDMSVCPATDPISAKVETKSYASRVQDNIKRANFNLSGISARLSDITARIDL